MMNFITSLILGTVLFSCSSCNMQPEVTFRVVGPINPRIVDYAEKQAFRISKKSGRSKVKFLIGYSPGGDAESLIRLVKLVNRNADLVFVSGECLSACAEFLYLVNKPIEAAPNAAIGFHGNALTALALDRALKRDSGSCLPRRAREFERMLRVRGVDPKKATLATIRQLQFHGAKDAPSDLGPHCKNAEYYSNYRFWFPTKTQLRSVFDIDVTGQVCADDIECIRLVAQKKWGRRSDIIVGTRALENAPALVADRIKVVD